MLVEKSLLLTKHFEKPNIIIAFNLLTIVNTNKIAKAKKFAILPKIPPRGIKNLAARH